MNWIERDGQVIDLPNLFAVVEKDGVWFVSHCPELGVASQGKTRQESHRMLAEAVELWLEAASATEIKRRLRSGARVRPLELQHA
ncbi:MAG: type II toxin-antitoxin system HicB family antitoxin [Verrucomicrobia bacterium]|nr:type II toxin-antitoxin system HicB family antitoxin [Verrucomicrobiota bacterium]